MNNKERVRNKCIKKNKRKVILLQYKDKRETILLTKTVRKRKETLKIKIECNTRRVNGENSSQNEKYPIFRAQMKERIVPRCLRDSCRRESYQKTDQCNRHHRQMKGKHRSRSHDKKMKRTPSVIIVNNKYSDAIQYDDISSGSLSSHSYDEIDTLMQSTRKRMRDLDEEWNLKRKQIDSISKKLDKSNHFTCSSKSPSLNSLDTLILEAEEDELTLQKLNNTVHSVEKCPKMIIKVEPQESNNNIIKEGLRHSECFQTACSKMMSPQKAIKIQPLEVNNNKIKCEPNYMSKNDFVSQKNKEIDAVIAKLERNDVVDSLINFVNIKQELYSDI